MSYRRSSIIVFTNTIENFPMLISAFIGVFLLISNIIGFFLLIRIIKVFL